MRKTDFCKNWRFIRKGSAPRTVDLPHDAQLEEQRGADMPSGSAGAYFAGGKYVYEKVFSGRGLTDKSSLLQFGGVYRRAEVTLNGEVVGGTAYGYLPFWVDLTGKLLPGENVLHVTADNSETPNSRWYSGAGIYRAVWLWTGERDHIVPERIKITTLCLSPAKIKIETQIQGHGEVEIQILDAGQTVAAGHGEILELEIPNARLWSADEPNLYTCRVTLINSGKVLDEYAVTFGIRTLEWSTKGLFVNGVETLLRGGCVHHDNGILGAVSLREAEERKIRLLKKWGFNAIRCAHNPASAELLDACDRMGMYVMDEMWDMWYIPKNPYDYSRDFESNWKHDIETVVRRDRNHPSVTLYSIGNEVTEPAEDRGNDLARELVSTFHALDPTRPVTAGINPGLIMMAKQGINIFGGEKLREEPAPVSSTDYNKAVAENGQRMKEAALDPEVEAASAGTLDVLDIAGYNYASSRYPVEGTEHPNRILVGSETFPQDIVSNWRMVEKYPYLIGDFMWTAWDYLGEAGIGAWVWDDREQGFGKPYPWLLAQAGALDILGDDTAEAGLAAAVFEKRLTPYMAVRPLNHPGVTASQSTWRGTNAIPSWSWRGCRGNLARVEVYTAASEVELFLNGTSLGRREVRDFEAVFEIPYSPGVLECVAYDKGAEVGRQVLKSAGDTLGLRVYSETELKAGRPCFIRVDVADADGTVEFNTDRLITVKAEGARLLAFGSAAPKSERSYLSGVFPTHYGRAMAVIVPAGGHGCLRVSSGSTETVFEFDADYSGEEE